MIRVLCLEDNLADAELLAYELRRDGIEFTLHQVITREEYIEALDNFQPDLVLADYSLPQFNAMEALNILKQKKLDIPFIVVTGTISEDVAVACMRAGAADYLIKDRLGRLGQAVRRALDEAQLRKKEREAQDALRASEEKFSRAFHLSPDALTINRLHDGVYLEVNQGFEFMSGYRAVEVIGKPVRSLGLWKDPSDLDRFVVSLKESGEVRNFPASFITRAGKEIHTIVSARTLVLDGEICVLSITRDITQLMMARNALEEAHRELEMAYDATIEGWALALELRDQETLGHTRRVTELAVRFGQRLGLDDDEIKILRRGVLLHDIGKMAVPDAILHKPGPLTDDEWKVMRLHPVYARQMLVHIDYLKPALVIPYSHHERWDGSGYPEGLKGEEIPLLARLFAIVDVWDSLSYDRVYRQGVGKEAALEYLRENAGKLFDPVLTEIFIEMIEEDLQAKK